MIPREYIDEVVRRSDITEVVSSYVQLRHRGRTHTGLCPFHSEKPELLLLRLRGRRRRDHLRAQDQQS